MPLYILFICLEGPSSLLALTDSYASFKTQFNWPFLWKVCFDILTDHNHSPLLDSDHQGQGLSYSTLCLVPNRGLGTRSLLRMLGFFY